MTFELVKSLLLRPLMTTLTLLFLLLLLFCCVSLCLLQLEVDYITIYSGVNE